MLAKIGFIFLMVPQKIYPASNFGRSVIHKIVLSYCQKKTFTEICKLKFAVNLFLFVFVAQ